MIREEFNQTKDIKSETEKNLSELDKQRIAGLENLFVFRRSEQAAETRNYERLRRKYGAAHPFVREAAAKIETAGVFSGALKREIIRTSLASPSPKSDAWTIYGCVFDEQNNVVKGAVVRLFDERGERLARSESAKTGADGAFLWRVTNIKNLSAKVRVGVSADFLGDKILTPALGKTDYAEITIVGKIDPHCEPPDDECEPSGEPIPTGQNFSDWMITGKIADRRGNGIANLRVRVFDKDLLLDDALGTVETDANGIYRLTFTKKQFSDFTENYPELYLVVEDQTGKTLFDGKRESRGKPGRIELIDVRLNEYDG